MGQGRADQEQISELHVDGALHVPGRLLVFIDDTETEEWEANPRVGLAIYSAVVLRSDDYPAIEADLLNCLARLPHGQYLHTWKIVHAKSDSEWRQYSIGERKRLLSDAGTILSGRVQRMYFAHARSDEYQAIRRGAVVEAAREKAKMQRRGGSNLPKGHKEGLRSVFHEPLLGVLQRAFPDQEFVVVQDNGGSLSDCRLEFPSAPCRLFDNSIYCLPSRNVSGLQLADLAAYSLLRAARRRMPGSLAEGPFDDVLSHIVKTLAPRTISLWQHLDDEGSANGSTSEGSE